MKLANSLSIGLGLLTSASALADHTTLACKIERWDGTHAFSKSYDVDCWDSCSISKTLDGVEFRAAISNRGSQLVITSSERSTYSGVKRVTIEGIPTLQSCYGGAMISDRQTVTCTYCQID